MIVDGGSKTFSSDRLSSGGPGHGRVVEAPDAVLHKMNEEHGFIDLYGSAFRQGTMADHLSKEPVTGLAPDALNALDSPVS